MAKHKSTDFMIKFVQDYINGLNDRLNWDLDFSHYLIQHYHKMKRENPDIADCFLFYLSEQGFDCAEGLADDEHKMFISKQLGLFFDAVNNGCL